MAQYLILIYNDEAELARQDPEFFDQLRQDHTKFGANNAGVLRGGNALESTATATSIGKAAPGTTTDGPFAETKEALGGYYLIEVADLDEAISVAKQVPAPFGGAEVRPVRVLD